jgi:hypothetical protein
MKASHIQQFPRAQGVSTFKTFELAADCRHGASPRA